VRSRGERARTGDLKSGEVLPLTEVKTWRGGWGMAYRKKFTLDVFLNAHQVMESNTNEVELKAEPSAPLALFAGYGM